MTVDEMMEFFKKCSESGLGKNRVIINYEDMYLTIFDMGLSYGPDGTDIYIETYEKIK